MTQKPVSQQLQSADRQSAWADCKLPTARMVFGRGTREEIEYVIHGIQPNSEGKQKNKKWGCSKSGFSLRTFS
jgi:hypothetical protein